MKSENRKDKFVESSDVARVCCYLIVVVFYYVRALYHYSLAKDGENKSANLQKAVYSLNDAEKEVKNFVNG